MTKIIWKIKIPTVKLLILILTILKLLILLTKISLLLQIKFTKKRVIINTNKTLKFKKTRNKGKEIILQK